MTESGKEKRAREVLVSDRIDATFSKKRERKMIQSLLLKDWRDRGEWTYVPPSRKLISFGRIPNHGSMHFQEANLARELLFSPHWQVSQWAKKP